MIFGANNTTLNNSLIITPQTVSNFTYLHGKNTWRFGASSSLAQHQYAASQAGPIETGQASRDDFAKRAFEGLGATRGF